MSANWFLKQIAHYAAAITAAVAAVIAFANGDYQTALGLFASAVGLNSFGHALGTHVHNYPQRP